MIDLHGAILLTTIMTGLLTVAQKWSAVNPNRIEDGPSWFWALIGAIYTMSFFVFAFVSKANNYQETAAVLSSFAFGAGIGPCFLTRFKPSPDKVPNPVLRWWMGKLEGFADAMFKAIVILPLGAIVTWVVHIDGGYWTSIFLALTLVVTKAGQAYRARKAEIPGECDLYISRQRMLIGGSVIFTMVVGVVSLILWIMLAKMLTSSFGHILISYKTAIAFVIGAGLHLH
jgi:hypothetical protein